MLQPHKPGRQPAVGPGSRTLSPGRVGVSDYTLLVKAMVGFPNRMTVKL